MNNKTEFQQIIPLQSPPKSDVTANFEEEKLVTNEEDPIEKDSQRSFGDSKKDDERIISRSCGNIKFLMKGQNFQSHKQISFKDNEIDPREISSIGDHQKGTLSNESNNALILGKEISQENFKELDQEVNQIELIQIKKAKILVKMQSQKIDIGFNQNGNEEDGDINDSQKIKKFELAMNSISPERGDSSEKSKLTKESNRFVIKRQQRKKSRGSTKDYFNESCNKIQKGRFIIKQADDQFPEASIRKSSMKVGNHDLARSQIQKGKVSYDAQHQQLIGPSYPMYSPHMIPQPRQDQAHFMQSQCPRNPQILMGPPQPQFYMQSPTPSMYQIQQQQASPPVKHKVSSYEAQFNLYPRSQKNETVSESSKSSDGYMEDQENTSMSQQLQKQHHHGGKKRKRTPPPQNLMMRQSTNEQLNVSLDVQQLDSQNSQEEEKEELNNQNTVTTLPRNISENTPRTIQQQRSGGTTHKSKNRGGGDTTDNNDIRHQHSSNQKLHPNKDSYHQNGHGHRQKQQQQNHTTGSQHQKNEKLNDQAQTQQFQYMQQEYYQPIYYDFQHYYNQHQNEFNSYYYPVNHYQQPNQASIQVMNQQTCFDNMSKSIIQMFSQMINQHGQIMQNLLNQSANNKKSSSNHSSQVHDSSSSSSSSSDQEENDENNDFSDSMISNQEQYDHSHDSKKQIKHPIINVVDDSFFKKKVDIKQNKDESNHRGKKEKHNKDRIRHLEKQLKHVKRELKELKDSKKKKK